MVPHPIFTRDGADISSLVNVPLHIALLGGTIRIPTVDGDVDLTIPAGTQSNEKKVLKRRGAPKLDSAGRGDHYVTLAVELPRVLSEEQKSLLRQAFRVQDSEPAKRKKEGHKSDSSKSSQQSSSKAKSEKESSKDTSQEKQHEGKGFFQYLKDMTQGHGSKSD